MLNHGKFRTKLFFLIIGTCENFSYLYVYGMVDVAIKRTVKAIIDFDNSSSMTKLASFVHLITILFNKIQQLTHVPLDLTVMLGPWHS